MRVTKKMLQNRLATFAALSGRHVATSPLDRGALILHDGTPHYGYDVQLISNDQGGVSVLFNGSAREVNAFLEGCIYALDLPRKRREGREP